MCNLLSAETFSNEIIYAQEQNINKKTRKSYSIHYYIFCVTIVTIFYSLETAKKITYLGNHVLEKP